MTMTQVIPENVEISEFWNTRVKGKSCGLMKVETLKSKFLICETNFLLRGRAFAEKLINTWRWRSLLLTCILEITTCPTSLVGNNAKFTSHSRSCHSIRSRTLRRRHSQVVAPSSTDVLNQESAILHCRSNDVLQDYRNDPSFLGRCAGCHWSAASMHARSD